MKTIDDLNVAGMRVLVRADLNVPLDGRRITDDARIRASLPATGLIFGRNVWQRQHDDSLRLATQLKDILAKYPTP